MSMEMNRISPLEAELKKVRAALKEDQESGGEGLLMTEEPGRLQLTHIEVSRILRERNEYMEKYMSLLEKIRYGCFVVVCTYLIMNCADCLMS